MSRRAANGRALLGAFSAAVDNLEAHVAEVNKLNVFPVPDGDTGSNMLATVRAALAEAEAVAEPTADRIAQAISYGALMGARGNSGVIASQIFAGMADGLGGKQTFDGADLARTLLQGTATAYRAVVKPVEGTILTVIREASVAARESAEAGGDLAAVLRAAVEGAEAAVAKTPTLLPILRDAGVVDAGGQGLFRLLQGALAYMEERIPRREQRWASFSATTVGDVPDENYGYETMFLLRPRKDSLLDVEGLRTALEAMGDSVLIAGGARAVKVHIHNRRPDQVIALGLSIGSLSRITVENLDAQSQEVEERKAAEAAGGPIDNRLPADRREVRAVPRVDMEVLGVVGDGAAERASGDGASGAWGASVAVQPASTSAARLPVVAVAAGDGLARIFEDFQVAAIVRGGQSANPSTGELLDAIETIDAKEIILLPNNPNVVLAARQASELSTRRVRVVPTRNAAEGFAALLAFKPEFDTTANSELMIEAGRGIQTLQVTEAVRDATLPGDWKVRQGQTIVLDPDDGLLAADDDSKTAVLAAIERLNPGFEVITVYWGSGTDEADANALAARIGEARPGVEVQVLEGGQPHYRYLISAE